jgi:hypothetical protein
MTLKRFQLATPILLVASVMGLAFALFLERPAKMQ